jgi:hypothetical protein
LEVGDDTISGIDEAILLALGRVTVEFQRMEQILVFLIQVLIDPDPRIGRIVTTQLSFQRICDMCLALFLYRTKAEELHHELANLVNRAKEAEQQRNSYVHSWWSIQATNDDTRPVGRFKSRLKKGEWTLDSEIIDAFKLDELANRMSSISSDLVRFMVRAKDEGFLDPGYFATFKRDGQYVFLAFSPNNW